MHFSLSIFEKMHATLLGGINAIFRFGACPFIRVDTLSICHSVPKRKSFQKIVFFIVSSRSIAGLDCFITFKMSRGRFESDISNEIEVSSLVHDWVA